MALISNNISGSASNNSKIGITGSVVIANVPGSLFPDQPGIDTVFFVSGSKGTGTNISSFGGDLKVSGTFYSLSGLTGSLTKLNDGSDYLRAGTNIQLTTGSSGFITIAYSGTSGSIYWVENTQAIAFSTPVAAATNARTFLPLGPAPQSVVFGPTNNGVNYGAISATVPNGGPTGGNTRGASAVDWQIDRNNQIQVASGIRAVIGGGGSNRASGEESVVAGGGANTAIGQASTVSGGTSNNNQGNWGTICGGQLNYIDPSGGFSWASILGGRDNRALAQRATVLGGLENTTATIFGLSAGYRASPITNAEFALSGGNFSGGSPSTDAQRGESQTTLVTLRRSFTNTVAPLVTELYVDGSSLQYAVAPGNTVKFVIQLTITDTITYETFSATFRGAMWNDGTSTVYGTGFGFVGDTAIAGSGTSLNYGGGAAPSNGIYTEFHWNSPTTALWSASLNLVSLSAPPSHVKIAPRITTSGNTNSLRATAAMWTVHNRMV